MTNTDTPRTTDQESAPKETSSGAAGYFSELFAGASDRFSHLGARSRRLAAIAACVVAAVVAFWIIDKIIYFYVARRYVDQIGEAFDLNKNIVNALVLSTFVAAVFFGTFIWSFSSRKRLVGISGIASLLIAHSVAVWWATRDQFFDRTGAATKCYVVTRDGTVSYGERPGTDPATGRECRPVTAEILERLREYEKGGRPKRITDSDPVFFEPRTGEPVVWYYRSKQNKIEIFDLMGFHPETGEELTPITKVIVEDWKQKLLARTPQRIDAQKFPLFDPVTGEPRAWYWRDKNGNSEFFDSPGFHPRTGDPLLVVTREISEELISKREKCYVVTRDGTVSYGERPGIDPATGRQCRPVTAEIVERLSEYEKGRRPKRITDSDPVFFEPRTGEPVVWYYRSKQNEIELFDLMGFHPEAGEELTPITKSVGEDWKQQTQKRLARVPQRIDAQKFPLFDPVTGEPRAWYWRDKNGNSEFFDSPGFHPRTGDPLLVVTREISEELISKGDTRTPKQVDIGTFAPFDPNTGRARVWFWRSDKGEYEFYDAPGFHPRTGEPIKPFTREVMRHWEQELKNESDRLDKEQKTRAEKEKRAADDLALKEQADKKKREEEGQRLTQAARACDNLAANPSDSKRVGEGVSFDTLKGQAQEAIVNCEIAVHQNPGELRYKYQLGRALQWIDRQRAFAIHQELVRLRYPSAFDNLGWLYLTEKKDHQRAVALFKSGIEAGDTDSMLSLAEMIDRGHWVVPNPSEVKAQLYCRAAQLGNRTASRACQTAAAASQQNEQARIQQLQQQQMMLQIMGNVLGNIPRR